MITDWLQGIGTILGVPGAIAAFILLFIKDKDKQSQINKLILIADELKKQTNEFELQTQQMREQNSIFKEQLDLLYSIQSGNKDQQEKLIELKKKELKSKNRPIFKWEEGNSGPKYINVKIKNVGEVARLLEFYEIGNGELIFVTPKGTEVAKNNFFQLEAEYSGKENIHNIDTLIEILLEDAVGNKYRQKFNIRGSKAEILPIEEVRDNNKD